MSIQYTLSGKQQNLPIEQKGTFTEQQLQGVDVHQDTALINIAIRDLRAQNIEAEWEACTLAYTTEDSTDPQLQEYIRYKKRWTSRSKRNTYNSKK
jgi:hypothetical protein